MKLTAFSLLFCLLLWQALFADNVLASSISTDTLAWSWEVTSTTSTMTKTCTLEFTGDLTLDWGDGRVQTLSDTLSGTALTHVYTGVSNYYCKAIGKGLQYFKADSRRLLTLDPTRSPALTYLSCTSNQLSTLDVSKNTELVSLYCGGNALTLLNVSKCSKLQTLTCSDNKLLSLDVSAIPTLKKLTCHTNLLTSLRVCSNGSLSYVSCLSCNLQVAELDTLMAQLPLLASVATSKNLYVLNNPGSVNCNIQLANLKNWTSDKVVTSSSFYMPTVSSSFGSSVELDVCLTNPVPVIAFELDVVFPSGFELDTLRSCVNAIRKGKHLLSIARTTTDQYKFMVYSMTSGDLIKGNSGVVLQLFGKAPDTANVYTVQLKQAVLVDTTTSMCNVTTASGQLSVLPASINGDVNGDKQVNVTDVVNLVAYINGKIPPAFNVQAADLDNNGVLNVADITRMVVLINSADGLLRSVSSQLATEGRALVLYDRQSMQSGNNLFLRQSYLNQHRLELCLDNSTPVQACQVDLVLPEGLSLQTNAVSCKTNRQNGHLVQIHLIEPNKYRLLVYALKPDASIKGDTGVVTELPILVAENLPSANYPIYLESTVLTGLDLTTIPSKGFDLTAVVSPLKPSDQLLKAGSDEQSGLWVQGDGLAEVYVWNVEGQQVKHQKMNGATSFYSLVPKGIYMVHAFSGQGSSLKQKVVVP